MSTTEPLREREIPGRQSVELKVELSFPRHSLHGDRAEIRIKDSLSGEIIAEIPFGAEQFMELMANAPVRVQSWVPDAEHAARLFHQRQAKTEKVPGLIIKGMYGKDQDVAVESWARRIAERDGWQDYRINSERGGPTVMFLRWTSGN